MTADTSAVVAALSAWHEDHAAAAEALRDVIDLPAHVVLESYAVLTRLPHGLAVPAGVAARVLGERFAGKPLTLPPARRRTLLATCAAVDVFGGAVYDGLVALEAAAHDRPLLTLDRRALRTYGRLGAAATLVG